MGSAPLPALGSIIYPVAGHRRRARALNDLGSLQELVEQVKPLVAIPWPFQVASVVAPSAFLKLATGWTSSPTAAIPLSAPTEPLRELIERLALPRPADAQTLGAVYAQCQRALTGSGADLRDAVDQLNRLGHADRLSIFESLRVITPPLENQNDLEQLHGIVKGANLPDINPALVAGMIVVLLRGSGRTLSSMDIAVDLVSALADIGVNDQYSLLDSLGIRGMHAEGTIATLTSAALLAAMISPSADLEAIFVGAQGATAIGGWNPPGGMPGGYYIGLTAHQEIAAYYRQVNAVDMVVNAELAYTNTIRVDSIVQQVVQHLQLPGAAIALEPLKLALAISKPDIFPLQLGSPQRRARMGVRDQAVAQRRRRRD